MNMKRHFPSLWSAFLLLVGTVWSARLTAESSQLSVSAEGMRTSDVTWFDTTVDGELKSKTETVRLDAEGAWVTLDYKKAPGDFFGHAAAIRTERAGSHLGWTHNFKNGEESRLKLGGYQGVDDFQSIWIGEYYRQQYEGFRGYETPNPQGISMSASLQSEVSPGRLWLHTELGFARDHVIPSYEIVNRGQLLRGPTEFRSAEGAISLEAIVSPRLRALLATRARATTRRRLRQEFTGGVLWALADHLVANAELRPAFESTRFSAWALRTGMEWDLENRWFWGISGRLYRDHGQFDPSIGQASRFPDRQSQGLELSCRWSGERASIAAAVGPYWSQYGKVPQELSPLAPLFQDRSWLSGRLDWSINF